MVFLISTFSGNAQIQFSEDFSQLDSSQSVDFNIADEGSNQLVTMNNTAVAENNNFCDLGFAAIVIRIYKTQRLNNGQSEQDSVGMFFDPEYNNGLDIFDAVKFFNFSSENLGINHNGTILSIEYRAMPVPGEEFQLYTSSYSETDYTFEIFACSLPGYGFYIEDAYTGTNTFFDEGEVLYHQFNVNPSISASKATDRFSIRVNSPEPHYVYENNTWTPENPSGVSTDADNILVKNGAANLTSDTEANNVTVLQYATLNVEDVLNVHGDLSIVGDLVFLSTEDGDGELGLVGGDIIGKATVHRYMSNNRSFRMISSPVNTGTGTIYSNWQEGANNPNPETNIDPNPGYGTHITGDDNSKGFDVTLTGNSSLYYADAGMQQFVEVDNTNNTSMEAGDAFLLFVRGNRGIDLTDNSAKSETILRTKGVLFNEDYSKEFNGMEDGKFLMVGNPFQSVVDMEEVLNNSTNLNTGHFYIYDPNLGDNGGYVEMIYGEGMWSHVSDNSDVNQYLQPGQAVQVVTDVSGMDDVSVNFPKSSRAPGMHTASHRGSGFSNILIGNLYTEENFTSGKSEHDSFGIAFNENYDNALTKADVVMPYNFNENIGVNYDGTYLSFERREFPINDEVFQLYTMGYAHTDYILKLSVNGLEDWDFYLNDRYTGTSTLLEMTGTNYHFTINEDPLSKASDRFSIQVKEKSLGIDKNNLMSNIRLYPNPLNNDTFHINTPKLNSAQVNISISDTSGRQIFESDFDNVTNQISVSMNETLAAGIYLVTLRSNGEEHTLRLVIE